MRDLEAEVIAIRKLFDWEKYHTPENLAQAIAGEAGELAHLYRWSPPGPSPSREQVAEELADLLVFMVNLAERLNIDLEYEFWEKCRKNRTRFDSRIPPARIPGQDLNTESEGQA